MMRACHLSVAVVALRAAVFVYPSEAVRTFEAFGKKPKKTQHVAPETNDWKGEVEITNWSGRVGNNIMQVAHAAIFAERIGAKKLILPKAAHKAGHKIHAVFDLPPELNIRVGEGSNGNSSLVNCGEDAMYKSKWFNTPCKDITGKEIKKAMRKYIEVHMNPLLKTCTAAPRKEGEDKMLTVHIRSGDVFGRKAGNFMSAQPPCSLYNKVITSGNNGLPFQNVLVITEAENVNPCVDTLKKAYPGVVKVQMGTLIDDACAILRSTNLMVAFSTFSHSLARISSNVNRLYGGSDPVFCGWKSGIASEPWDGVVVHSYYVPGQHQSRYIKSDNVRWMLNYPEEKIEGPSNNPCSAGYRMKS